MVDHSEPIPTGVKLSRRDFLKLSALGGGAAAMPPAVVPQETEKPKILEIETPYAHYYPVYEDHGQPATKDDLAKLPPLDLYFYEFTDKSDKLVNMDGGDILNIDTAGTSVSTLFKNERDYFFPRDHLEVFTKNGTEITFEGSALPEGEVEKEFLLKMGEIYAGIGGTITYFVLKKKHELKKTGKPFVPPLADFTSKAALAWLLSPAVGVVSNLTAISKGTETELHTVQRIAGRIGAMVSHAHPEDHHVFFRNLLMTRKLQFLGKFLSGEHPRKPKIGYNVGVPHGGIEEFLKLSPDTVLVLLNAYPAKFWKKVIDVNGGIDAFCTAMLLTPDLNNSKKTVIPDVKLRQILKEKLAEIKDSES